MQNTRWQPFKSAPQLLAISTPDLRQQEWRLQFLERNVGLPVKVVILSILFYYLFLSNWMTDGPLGRDGLTEEAARRSPQEMAQVTPQPEELLSEARRFAQDMVQLAFLVYVAVNIGVGFILLGMHKLSLVVVQWAVFTGALIDGLFLSAMVLITGGLDSALFWLYVVLLIRNSVSIAGAAPQIMLNLLTCLFFATVIRLDAMILGWDGQALPDLGKPFLLRLLLLLGVAGWCYGLQVLLDRQFRSLDEQREMTMRREQLEASGRLAAEIAHQLKNPLAIINNASYTLQRTLKEGKGTITQQIKIIREEVERSDRIITELMGYAQLAEGRVEKLDVQAELERAILQVFPPAVKYEMALHCDIAPALPQLLAQRNHLAEILVNLLQNAREVTSGRGNLWITAEYTNSLAVVITIADDGPGIPPEHRERIFEPYFTTREKGSGLGLAIVKHNAELYGGKVQVESELGKGTRFIVEFPARTLMKLRE